ncbi:DNA polymerase III subunit delta [Patescibacteria group bacterium]|nr:DNA polymerase III subunit delta [Patescibacteria group bacterium]
MIIFLYGPDSYRSRQKLLDLKKKFVHQQDKQALSVSIINGHDLTIDGLRKSLLSHSLFSQKRLIIIEEILKEKINKQKQSQLEAVIKEIIKILKNKIQEKNSPTDKTSNIFIFWEPEIKLKELTQIQLKLYQLLIKTKYVQEFKPLTQIQLKNWVEKEVEKNGAKIENQAIKLLTEIYDSNLFAIKNELDKLVARQNDGRSIISVQDLKNIIFNKTEQNIWQLIDAIGQKNKKLAISLLSDQLKNGAKIDYLISMLAHQYRTIFRIKSYLKNHSVVSHYQVAKVLSLHPFVCQKGIRQEKNYNLEELKKIYHQLLEIDFIRKTRPINPEILLDLLIIKN